MTGVSSIKRPETLKDIAYREIRNILFQGGAQNNLLTANQLANDLGVSRTPVREALLQLAYEGILDPIDGRGFRIRNFSEKEIRNFFEARRVIELHVVESVAGKIEAEQLHQIEKTIERMDHLAESANQAGFLQEDEKFHLQLMDWHDNQYLKGINEQLRMLVKILGQKALAAPGRGREVLDEHRAVVTALKAADPRQAGRAMENHLRNTEEQLLKGLRKAESEKEQVGA
jgi:DNA-binding GntR family transcriptional regulator